MTKEEGLEFLRQHQPMPPDTELTEELARKYNEIREYFIDHPDPECIPLFLNSFGERDGFGVYQLVEDVIAGFDEEVAVPYIIKALEDDDPYILYWVAQSAARFSSPELTYPLKRLLSYNDTGVRSMAVYALSMLEDERVDSILQEALPSEPDESIRAEIEDALEYRDNKRKQS